MKIKYHAENEKLHKLLKFLITLKEIFSHV